LGGDVVIPSLLSGTEFMAKPRAGPANPPRNKNEKEIELHRITEFHRTVRTIVLCFFGTTALAIIAWAAVRITDKPPWLQFALAVLGVIVVPSLIVRKLLLRVKLQDSPGRVDSLLRYLTTLKPSETTREQTSEEDQDAS
jgi:hypothetical protein